MKVLKETLGRCGAGFLTLLVKVGFKLMATLAKMTKALKVGKVGLATASFAGYAYIFTWKFALVLMASIFLHECGHVWAMRRCGVPTRGIYFIPFLGAAAVGAGLVKSRAVEVYVALWGPTVGMLLAVLVGFAYYFHPEPALAAVASWIAMINLFNLLPINPLDGGRVLKSLMFSVNRLLGLVWLSAGVLIACMLATRINFGLFSLLAFVGFFEFSGELWRKSEWMKRWLLEKRRKHEADHSRAIFVLRSPWVGAETTPSIWKAEQRNVSIAEKSMKWCDQRLARMSDAPDIPSLSAGEFFMATFSFVGLVAILWVLMVSMKHVPGAEVALKVLEG